MLVLHQDKVLGCILSKLIPEAKHSLEAVLRCLQALARDLRSDFVTRSFGSSVDGIAQLLKTDVAREPELLEFTFQALAFMCKWCQRQLVLDLPGALQMTKPLREHPQVRTARFPNPGTLFYLSAGDCLSIHRPIHAQHETDTLFYLSQAHVRVFAAQAVAFLLRAAPDASVGDGINALFVEATRDCGDGDKKQKEQEANLHGAGVLLAEAVKGAGKGLHSRAERVLKAAFRPRRLFLRDAEEKKKKPRRVSEQPRSIHLVLGRLVGCALGASVQNSRARGRGAVQAHAAGEVRRDVAASFGRGEESGEGDARFGFANVTGGRSLGILGLGVGCRRNSHHETRGAIGRVSCSKRRARVRRRGGCGGNIQGRSG